MMKRFTCVDVAEAGDDALIEEGDFERDFLPLAGAGEGCGIELRRQRFGTHLAQRRVVIALSAG
jgi:hypothetical protein